MWSRPSDKFNKDLLNQTKMYRIEELENMYGQWDKYATFVFDVEKYRPSPAQSGKIYNLFYYQSRSTYIKQSRLVQTMITKSWSGREARKYV